MKALFIHLILLLLCTPLFARHGKGGSITYEYIGDGAVPGTSRYRITVKHYIDCSGTQFIESSVYVGVIDASTNKLLKTLTFGQKDQRTIEKKSYSACINKKPVVCYVVVTYITETELTDNKAGYILAEQECCRIGGIINIQNSSTYGITNINTIPGVIDGIIYRKNSSPVYAQKDTAVICHKSYFEIDFSATDDDGDVLTYAFCSAKIGGTAQTRQPNPPGLPPYQDISYTSGYSADAPLGFNVKIDPQTGIISGIAPAQLGSYVVSVCVTETRNGTVIGTTKKEVQVNVADCNLSAATLEPSYVNCDDFDFGFRNKSASSAIDFYHWDFGVANTTTDTSMRELPFFTYPDTGTYLLKLKVSTRSGCEDSAEAKVIVYPGFNPAFTVAGNCYQSPFLFSDSTYARYGSVESWQWDFGDSHSETDTSSRHDVKYQFPQEGEYPVTLAVTTSKGCFATITKTVKAPAHPSLSLSVKDTLICKNDSLQIKAVGTGIFSWNASPTMIHGNTSEPVVFPSDTTMYFVTLNDHGCMNADSVIVNVIDHIDISLTADTTICTGDVFSLAPVSKAIQYEWTPHAGLDNPFARIATGRARSNARYQLHANLGSCSASASADIRVVNYPEAKLPPDTSICYGSNFTLHATARGASFLWNPSGSLLNASTLSPIAHPIHNTSYVLAVYDTLGCPKPALDTMEVRVYAPVMAFAGNDTSITANQPLQLMASGGVQYEWSPAYGLTNNRIANPVANLNGMYESATYIVRVTTAEGCVGSDAVQVKIFRTAPEIFVPTAFTPNQDGMNDILRPVLVGIRKLDFFNIYNRWGKLVYSTTEPGKGWDGRNSGTLQENGNYVFVVQAVDFNGNIIRRKGFFVLLK